MKPQSMPVKERDHLFKRIDKEIEAIERRHGADVARWAMNRYIKEQADRTRIEREKKRLEAELAELNAR